MKNRIRIKMCGMMQKKDINYAITLGVDAIGLIFYEKSPRYVSAINAHDITQDMPPFCDTVGVFVNHSASEVKAILNIVDLDYLQFHGDESAEFCQQFDKPYIKVVRVKNSESIINACQGYKSSRAILLDTFNDKIYGGTGKPFDWHIIPMVDKPLFIAGGLTPQNCVDVINTEKAYALDVCSGVELTPGKKDWVKMQAFVEKAWG
jgi:phosphoribosylanthranilate isomerase